jgi:hypothetical protein
MINEKEQNCQQLAMQNDCVIGLRIAEEEADLRTLNHVVPSKMEQCRGLAVCADGSVPDSWQHGAGVKDTASELSLRGEDSC